MSEFRLRTDKEEYFLKKAGQEKIPVRRRGLSYTLGPEKQARFAEAVRIQDLESPFTHSELLDVALNLAEIQLTEGCNGGCSDCYLKAATSSITKIIPYDSFEGYIRKYQGEISRVSYYGNSDPLDYATKDGRTITDVYKLMREVKPDEKQYISTTIPPGSEERFIMLMQHLYDERGQALDKNKRDKASAEKNLPGQKRKLSEIVRLMPDVLDSPEQYTPSPPVTVRISLVKHNVSRVIETFERLSVELFAQGVNNEEINEFYNAIVIVNDVFHMEKLGNKIGEHDDMLDVWSPACQDGIFITPEGVFAAMMTAATKYESSGEKRIPFVAGMPIPKRIHVLNYVALDYAESRYNKKYFLLPPIMTIDFEEYTLPDPIENSVLHLGREIMMLNYLIRDIHGLSVANSKILDDTTRIAFIKESTASFIKNRRPDLIEKLEAAKALGLNERNLYAAKEIEKVQDYISLTEHYLAKTDFLTSVVQQEEKPLFTTIHSAAMLVREIGKPTLDKLSQEGISLQEFLADASPVKFGNDIYEIFEQTPGNIPLNGIFYQALWERIGKYFDIEKHQDMMDNKSYPKWYKQMARGYAKNTDFISI